MNIFNIINNIYKKDPILVSKIDTSLCILLTSILRLDKYNIEQLRRVVSYMFFIHPKHYIMLLFVYIRECKNPPFLKGINKKEKVKEDKLYNKIAYLFDWSSKELNLNKPIMDKVINREQWCKELGVKK